MTLLRDLIPEIELDAAIGDRPVTGLTADSRAVKPGSVFFAVPGVKADGMTFAAKAAANGAAAIVGGLSAQFESSTPLIRAADVREALARAAATFYPRQPATIAAVTGTSGKTSVAAFTRQIWLALGHQAAALGTTGIIAPSGSVYGSLTTPDPVTLHKTLDELAADGVTHLTMEASSHGLDQRRLDGVRLAAAAFTNLSRDHLDYHPTLDDYLDAKLRLFKSLLQPGQTAVVDADSDVADRVAAACKTRGLQVMTTGVKGDGIRISSPKAPA